MDEENKTRKCWPAPLILLRFQDIFNVTKDFYSKLLWTCYSSKR